MIEIKNIKKSYGIGENKTQILKGISLSVEESAFTIILGASGSGKSTFLNIISGLERADEGNILYNDIDITRLEDDKLTLFRKQNIGFVFQQYYLLPNMNIDKNVKMGADLVNNKDYQSIIEAVGSGGEQQRVSVARALAKKPKVLFLDEPTGALDETTGRQLLDYISKLHDKYKFTVVMVTHNQNIAEMADTVVTMNSGNILNVYTNTSKKNAYEIGW